MLEENKALRMRLHSLTIFRGLLEDPVVSRLAALLHAQPSDAEACADAYCAFAAALYERGGDLSTYLLKAVLEDEKPVCPPGGVRCADSRRTCGMPATRALLFAGAFPI